MTRKGPLAGLKVVELAGEHGRALGGIRRVERVAVAATDRVEVRRELLERPGGERWHAQTVTCERVGDRDALSASGAAIAGTPGRPAALT